MNDVITADGRRRPRVKKEMNRNQLIRMREIFGPFFKVLNDYCTSYSIYKCHIYGETLLREGGKEEHMVNFDFVVSGANGTLKEDYLVYSFERDDVFFSDKFTFERGHEEDVIKAIKKLIYDFNSITTPFNKITVENGTRWVLGIIGEDVDRNGVLYEGYVIFLKSDLAFEEYAIPTNENDVVLY